MTTGQIIDAGLAVGLLVALSVFFYARYQARKTITNQED